MGSPGWRSTHLAVLVVVTSLAIVRGGLGGHNGVMPEQALEEIRAKFGGVPNVFTRMHEVGDLAENWVHLRELYEEDVGPVPSLVIEVLLTALALRCRYDYCFVMHSLTIAGAGVDKVEIEGLVRLLMVPSIVPDHARWSRIVRLAWLAEGNGDHRHAAAHALGLACSPEEHQQVLSTCSGGALLTSYVARFALRAEDEPSLARLPAELRELIPEFVSFHVAAREGEAGERPVSVTCSSCRRIKSATDEQWYPHESAALLLPDDVLFSHGLCETCLAGLDLGT